MRHYDITVISKTNNPIHKRPQIIKNIRRYVKDITGAKAQTPNSEVLKYFAFCRPV
jgi:hypothetical protein